MPCYSSFVLKETDFIMKAPDCLCPQRICPEFKDYYPTSLRCGFLREFLIYGNCWCIMFILLTETEAVLQVLSHFYCHAAGQTEWDSNDRLQMKWSGKSLPQRQNLQMCSSELFFFFKNTHEQREKERTTRIIKTQTCENMERERVSVKVAERFCWSGLSAPAPAPLASSKANWLKFRKIKKINKYR